MKKVLLSGIQPSGKIHIGNYFGAIQQFIDYQDKYDSYISVVNYHALTSVQDSKKLSSETMNVAIDHLAVGIDPTKSTLFVQSDVPEVTELAWIFNTLITTAYLERGVAYKEKVARGLEASAGLLTYPVLQAADILIMNADVVPVGADQKQHIEFARDIAEKFNNAYGETFTLPEHIIEKASGVIPGVDGQKMSKSYGNTISLFATDEEIEKAVMRIPTDSRGVDEPKDLQADIIFKFHELFSRNRLSEIKMGYEKGGLSYSDSKKELITNIKTFIAPLREERARIASDLGTVREILKNGAEKARTKATAVMKEVREKTGLSY
jgi:tryptophanyl-tRNA synthetase